MRRAFLAGVICLVLASAAWARTSTGQDAGRARRATDVATGAIDLGVWRTRAPARAARQEVGFARVGKRFFLSWGGTTHQRYNARRNRWRTLNPLPADLDHIQTVTLAGSIYSLGGLVRAPRVQPKPPSGSVWIYDPAADAFSRGTPMPAGRERGAGGIAVWNGRLYYFGGLRDGIAVRWVDVYDPVANEWRSLPDMPRARDHFHAAVVGETMYAIGGRAADPQSPFAFNDAYTFTTGTWTTGLAPLPTARGGYASAVVQGHVLVIGGEGGGAVFSTVEAYDPISDTWATLAEMPTARHGIQAVVWRGKIFIAGGGAVAGGGEPTDVLEVFRPPAL